MLKKFFNKETICYLIFGVLATLLNIVSYKFFTFMKINYLISNLFAWILSVIFAFYTNKYFVFESKNNEHMLQEFISFVSGRLFTGTLDMLIMFICVDLITLDDFIVKICSNILVIILNYIISKLLVFKKDTTRKDS